MSKYFFSTILLLLTLSGKVLAQDDTTAAKEEPRVKEAVGHQLRLGVDIVKPISSSITKDVNSYELALDYYWKKDMYLVAEGGWGSASFDSSYLRYDSKNTFFRVGIDKSMLKRLMPGDWDMVFIGARYGIAFIDRSQAFYATSDDFWGNTSGTIPAKTFTAHWAEITGGVKVELFKGLFAGWNVRGKFLLNKKPFQELPPSNVAGYGKGEKGSVFDFNFYLSYAIRWGMPKDKQPTISPN